MTTRVGDAEREHAVAQLRQHLLDGRLEMEDFATRVGAAYAAGTQEELDALMTDLPRLPTVAAPSRNGRHGEVDAPLLGWRPTPERFRDPSTGRIMRVWVDRADGRRHYVAES
jgi:hypothetical protein